MNAALTPRSAAPPRPRRHRQAAGPRHRAGPACCGRSRPGAAPRSPDRCVRAARQGALKLRGPVGGKDEQDICILLQSIHLVEKLVEQRFLARPHPVAITRNQIDILDHDHSRLQKAGQIHVVGEQSDLRCGNDQSRVTGQVARQIADGMGLAGSGRPVKQDALAGRLSQPAQLRANSFIEILGIPSQLCRSRQTEFCPTGKSVTQPVTCVSSPVCKNILVFRRPKSPLYTPPSRLTEGRLEIVTDARRDAVDADGAPDEGA
jgi:hypothetical protein